MSKLRDKVALVTGGSRGIGAGIAKRLAADGAKVAITYTKGADAAASIVKEIESGGGKAIAIQADAADPNAVTAAVEKTVAAFGGLDVLVNNAGTAIPKTFEESTLEEMDRVIDINVRGVFVATKAALKHMKDGGRIITIGSCVGERMMTPGLVPYSATKGAVRMFSQGLAREVGEPGHHGEQHPAGPDRHRFESRGGRLGGATGGEHRAQAVWACGRGGGTGGVRRRSGGLVHHRGKSYCRWWDECLRGRALGLRGLQRGPLKRGVPARRSHKSSKMRLRAKK